MSKSRVVIALLLAVGLGGCLRWFDHPWKHTDCPFQRCDEEMVLYSLAGGFPKTDVDSKMVLPEQKQVVDKIDPLTLIGPSYEESLHGWQVLGKTTITDSGARKRIHEVMQKGIKDHDGSVAACFDPHHALRINRDGKTTEWIICFMCNQIRVYENGRQQEPILISTSPRPVLNEILRGANVTLSKAAE